MNITVRTSLLFTGLLVTTGACGMGSAKDEKMLHGEKMHQDHCLKCHTDEVYKRENRVVKTINALGKQVRICRDSTGTPWFDEDTDAVVHFLNQKYYKF